MSAISNPQLEVLSNAVNEALREREAIEGDRSLVECQADPIWKAVNARYEALYEEYLDLMSGEFV